MTNYREILRLFSLGISNSEIAAACGCSRTTVINVLARADSRKISWSAASAMPDKELNRLLQPGEGSKVDYNMPDYKYVHLEMGKSGVTITPLWLEYCDQCRQSGVLEYLGGGGGLTRHTIKYFSRHDWLWRGLFIFRAV